MNDTNYIQDHTADGFYNGLPAGTVIVEIHHDMPSYPYSVRRVNSWGLSSGTLYTTNPLADDPNYDLVCQMATANIYQPTYDSKRLVQQTEQRDTDKAQGFDPEEAALEDPNYQHHLIYTKNWNGFTEFVVYIPADKVETVKRALNKRGVAGQDWLLCLPRAAISSHAGPCHVVRTNDMNAARSLFTGMDLEFVITQPLIKM